MKTIIIAEIGECFNGSMPQAQKLIRVAKSSGCDFAKFQTLDFENISDQDPEKEWFKKIALTPRMIGTLKKYAQKTGIGILFTPENVKTARWLKNAGLTDIKIASSTITDNDLLDYINKNFKRVFLSTGMASLKEVDNAVARLHTVKNLYVLHCISEYPTGPLLQKRGLQALALKDTRLNMMKILAQRYPMHGIGYSDHTDGLFACVVATAAGAEVIEKHITLNRTTPIKRFKSKKGYLGTDHVLSLEPDELHEMVRQIRLVEAMMGKNEWERSDGEKILSAFLRSRFSHET